MLADVERLEGQLCLLKSRMRSLRVLDPSGSVAGTLARGWRELTALSFVNACGLEAIRADKSLTTQYRTTLSKLQHITIFNDAFFIWHDGQYGTINGLRLGCVNGQPVDWMQVNAAMGYVALLLAAVCSQTGCKFSEFRIVPQGSFSKVTKHGDERKTHELFFDNRMFAMSRFNQGLRCLAQCMQELAAFVMEKEPSIRLPYVVADFKVHGIPIVFDKEMQWTRAMKYLLTNLKWVLSWATTSRSMRV